MTTVNTQMIYEPCLPEGEGHHECIGVGVPADEASPAIGACACTCHRGVVITNAHRPEDDARATIHALRAIAYDADINKAIRAARAVLEKMA